MQARASSGRNSSTSKEASRADYEDLLSRNRRGRCPALFLAPMEGLGDRRFRRAFERTIGGFDEACTEFIRVPNRVENESKMAKGLANMYDRNELVRGTPIAAQLMGSNPELLGLVAGLLCEKNPPRIDLNCGCPSNRVTGRGSGSSLLKTPDRLHECATALVRAVKERGTDTVVSVKMRSGYEDASLLQDNLLAAQESGATFVTLHPRTRTDGYRSKARWEHIAFAKDILAIPVVGNGDVVNVSTARKMLEETGCDGIMIGRGAVQDPFLFHRCKLEFGNDDDDEGSLDVEADRICEFVRCLAEEFRASHGETTFKRKTRDPSERNRKGIDSLKQVCKYLFTQNQDLRNGLVPLLRQDPNACTFEAFQRSIQEEIRSRWKPGGSKELVHVDHFHGTSVQVHEKTMVL